MVVFILTWLYIGFTLEFCPFLWDILDNSSSENPFFFYFSFLFFFFLNYFIIFWKELFNNNKDVLYKYISLFFNFFSVFLTIFYSSLKNFFFFLKNFNFNSTLTLLKDIFKKLYLIFPTIWKPIFKKWSYFGFFKTNRSKWWKNK